MFVGSDFISIYVQSAGGGLASAASSNESGFKVGNNMLLAGVSFQVINMTFCGGLILAFVWRRRQALKLGPVPTTNGWDSAAVDLPPCLQGTAEEIQKNSKVVNIFIWSLGVTYFAIIARCIYRLVLCTSHSNRLSAPDHPLRFPYRASSENALLTMISFKEFPKWPWAGAAP